VDDLRTLFGQQLRKLRREANWSQAELAEAVDRSTDMISRLERGAIAPSFDTLEAIADVFDAHPAELLGGKPAHPTPDDKRMARVMKMVRDAEPARLAQIERLIAALGE